MGMNPKEYDEFIAERRAEGLLIDPATAETHWHWAPVLDPYNILDLAEDERCLGRVHFARRPGSDIWVESAELPKATIDALRQKGLAKEEDQ